MRTGSLELLRTVAGWISVRPLRLRIRIEAINLKFSASIASSSSRSPSVSLAWIPAQADRGRVRWIASPWLAAIAQEIGFAQLSVSDEVAPLIKLIGRGDTTVADAYLSPVLRRYVDRVAEGLPDCADLHFMQSNGGLAVASSFRGKDAILSGPAGGVVGMISASADHIPPTEPMWLIGFDMGGTSTDVSHFAGQFELADESVVEGRSVSE